MSELLWLNGKTMPLNEGVVSIEDRGFTFSDGIYEVVLFYDGKPFMLREHLERWKFSAEGLMIEMPGTVDSRVELLTDLVKQSKIDRAMVYGQLTRGKARRNHLFPDPPVAPTELWFVREAPTHEPSLYENGVKLMAHPDERWAHCQYKSISLLPNVLAKERARRVQAYEALLHREDGTVTECSASNAYCFIGGVLFTHPISHRILGGITRIAIIDAARELGIEVRQEAKLLDDFLTADEVFISSTTMEVMPVSRIDDHVIGSGKAGELTSKLGTKLHERILEECGAGG